MTVVCQITEDQAPLLVRSYFADGDPGPITATLAQAPELLGTALAFLGAVLSPSGIDFRTKEIVILRTSAIMGCRYCVDSHTLVAVDAGLTSRQVRALRNEEGHQLAEEFSDPRERLLVAWTDAVATGRGYPDDSLTVEIQRSYADHEIVELTLLVTVTLLLNRYASALRLPVGDATVQRLEAEGYTRAG